MRVVWVLLAPIACGCAWSWKVGVNCARWKHPSDNFWPDEYSGLGLPPAGSP